ncbi:pyruvate carboxylase [Raphidocelis subcapitata]|uniref:Pyruvate carboxylase n=1 Tax=Raphidocelis subcapitata TaxID=307507 RepID=A0A2V0P0A7_9CHLO|nr:pyruvate carboxylase [Raphidocelis subcapitata]|eukprot:GBF90515.1 pyruvate carboxylase [Raphidocelis subcapitata]
MQQRIQGSRPARGLAGARPAPPAAAALPRRRAAARPTAAAGRSPARAAPQQPPQQQRRRGAVAVRVSHHESHHEDRMEVAHTGEVPFRKIMCANRGEIAIRIFRAGTELGLRTVAVYSPSDKLQPHRYNADEAYVVGSPEMAPVACYLDVEGIIRIAKQAEVDAIHPGYGFLSENTNFARRCEEEGIAFIGPRAETIEAMGDKTAARRAAEACHVPTVPGTNHALQSADEAKEFANKPDVGYPVILKASMGGGGRGMRVVRNDKEMAELFARASNEARSAFGDGSMFVEKYVEEPRHIEIQIIADHYGNVVHLYERDCSVQRRHQKVVEVAPAPALDQKIKDALYADAVKLARHVGYRNAGTVEFMVDKEGRHYFLEVNPRVQVEHTVTEEVTGVDIVQAQIKIAGGATLSDLGLGTQEQVPPLKGFAIQCRVTSEDPEQNFQPDSGRLEAYRVPGGPGIRLDGAVTTGNVVSRYYDSLLAKVVASAPTFPKAVQRMARALQEFQVRGIKTNIPFLENVLRHPDFLGGAPTTAFIETNHKDLFTFEGHVNARASKLLLYLADMVVNGANHPGAVGAPPSRHAPPAPAPPQELASGPLRGWRDVYLREGAWGWARAVRAHKGLLLTDTTMRDAHQSLLATRMRTHDLLKAADATARVLAPAGSLEMWGGATFDVALRFLHECPWRRLEQLRERIPNIPFQMLLRGANAVGYTSYPDNVVREFCREARVAGVDIFRVFDSLNYLDNLRFGIDAVRAAGGIAEGTICYTGDVTDPTRSKYNLDYYLDLAEALVEHGVHSLGIKDMAGLLKPRAATLLISSLRERHPDLVIHVHTHDSAGTGVASMLAAAAAGADMVDAALDSMSGLTSQPSMGALVGSLAGTDLDTGIDPHHLLTLSDYWESTRELYAPFEANMRYSSSDVYYHEMPGGQYTNLNWGKVQKSYAAANKALGDIVKVTPSSKVVGDLAQFMVQNDLDENSLVERASELSFPGSVVEFMQGYIGQPAFGFPEPLRSRVLKGKPTIEGRPGASLPPMNLDSLESRLREKYGARGITKRDVLSAAMYPKVFEEYMSHVMRYSNLVEKLPTRAFLVPMAEDEEVEIELAAGVSTHIKLKAAGELQPSGKREVFFEANGVPRVVELADTRSAEGLAKKAVREKADPSVLGSVGAPMAGAVIEVSVKPGQAVHAGQQLAVLSAMKMETSVCAPCAGVVTQVAIDKGDNLDAGDLLVIVEAGAPNAPPLATVDSDPLATTDSAAAAAASGARTVGNGNGNGGGAAGGAAPQQPAAAAGV